MHHIAINCNDLQASLKFYHEILGWEYTRVVPGPDIDATYLRIPGGCELELMDRHGDQVNMDISPYLTGLDHFAVEVDDPQPYYELLKKNGYKFKIDLTRFDQFGHYTCGVLDPDGIMVEFIANYDPENKE